MSAPENFDGEPTIVVASGFDSQGSPYQITRRGRSFDVLLLGRPVGTAHCCQLVEGELVLGDLFIEESIPLPWLWPFRALQLFGVPVKTLKPRKRGLGTVLLREVLKYVSEERSITLLYGDVVERDLKIFPALPSWYERHGFTLGPPKNSARTWAKYGIYKYFAR